jgi:hypothetical protein
LVIPVSAERSKEMSVFLGFSLFGAIVKVVSVYSISVIFSSRAKSATVLPFAEGLSESSLKETVA